jgi:hypothetical protein
MSNHPSNDVKDLIQRGTHIVAENKESQNTKSKMEVKITIKVGKLKKENLLLR